MRGALIALLWGSWLQNSPDRAGVPLPSMDEDSDDDGVELIRLLAQGGRFDWPPNIDSWVVFESMEE